MITEGFATLAAFVGFLCGVTALRNLECSVLTKRWHVLRLYFDGMLPLMNDKGRLMRKLFCTFTALVWFLACVNSLMINESFLLIIRSNRLGTITSQTQKGNLGSNWPLPSSHSPPCRGHFVEPRRAMVSPFRVIEGDLAGGAPGHCAKTTPRGPSLLLQHVAALPQHLIFQQ